ncbi:hypothetical protein FRC03_003825 [Tulasnella sp. 419]|nr:hypothetical protein FRC03_003825 [Tulasnella sp. 419]
MSIGLSALVALIKLLGESQIVVQIVHALGWTASGVKAATVAASIQTPLTLSGSQFAILQSYGATHAAVAAPGLLGALPVLLGVAAGAGLIGWWFDWW